MNTLEREAEVMKAEEIARWEKALAKLPALYSSESTPIDDKIMGAKWFGPGRYTYYATEYDPEQRILFGYCISPLGPECDEWGYQSVDELAELINPMKMIFIELDRHFTPTRFGDLDVPKRF